MAAVNSRRVLIGALAGGVVWNLWSMFVNVKVLGARYVAAQQAGQFLAQPRYAYFLPVWIVTVFVLAYILAWLYASTRATLGAGPGTALKLGLLVGFAMAFPNNFSGASWMTLPRIFPLWWMLDMWMGAVLATLVAGWLYHD